MFPGAPLFNSQENFEALHAYLAGNGAAIAVDAPPSEQNLEAISFTLTDYVDAKEEAKQEAHADVAEAYRTPTGTQWNEFLRGIRTEVVTQAEATAQGRTAEVLLAEDAANTYPRPFPRVLKVGDRVSFDIRNQVVGLLARCGEVARITNEYIYIENDYIGQTHRYTKRRYKEVWYCPNYRSSF